MIDMSVIIPTDTSLLQQRKLDNFGCKVNKFGFNFAVCNSKGQLLMLQEAGQFASSKDLLVQAGLKILNQSTSETTLVQHFETDSIIATTLRTASDAPEVVALIDTGDSPMLQRDYMAEMLELFADLFSSAVEVGQQTRKFSSELAQTYEELVLLHKLSANMRLNESDSNYLQLACDSLTDIVDVEGIVIILENVVDNEHRFVLAAGSGLIEADERMASILHNRLVQELNRGKEALLDSEVDAPFRYDWPENIKNIIVVPLCVNGKKIANPPKKNHNNVVTIGVMAAINVVGKPDFDTTDIKLFNSVANTCAVFIENGTLFKDLKELFIGSLKALTSSIDAKDPYTRGHSERVAFISRWIAENIAKEEELEPVQIHNIYLSGLLHDIGKMGISEAVLRKKGKLTSDEFDHIRTHPSVGASILSEIKQMRDIVPGVLYHHERIDGKGYPNGLKGDQIPLSGKIICVADSFDAMTSKRTYRDAMTMEQALEEIKRGLGIQFDEKVGKIFINSNVNHLWSIMRDGFTDNYGMSDFSEYGSLAVGTLIR